MQYPTLWWWLMKLIHERCKFLLVPLFTCPYISLSINPQFASFLHIFLIPPPLARSPHTARSINHTISHGSLQITSPAYHPPHVERNKWALVSLSKELLKCLVRVPPHRPSFNIEISDKFLLNFFLLLSDNQSLIWIRLGSLVYETRADIVTFINPC